MPTFRHTLFLTSSEEDGPPELFGTDASRVVLPLDVLNPTTPGNPVTTLDKRQAVEDFLGTQVLSGSSTASPPYAYISRLTPADLGAVNTAGLGDVGPYLYATGIARSMNLRPKEADANTTGVGGVHGLPIGPRWRAWFQFETLKYQIKTDAEVHATAGPLFTATGGPYPDEGDALRRGWFYTRYISRYIKPGVSILKYRAGTLGVNYSSDGKPYSQDLSIREPFATVEYIWHAVPYSGVPWNAITSALGCINDNIFDGFFSSTLLLDEMDLDQHRGPLGDWLVDIKYMMKYLPHRAQSGTEYGHNSKLRFKSGPPATLDYDYLTYGAAGTITGVFPKQDFSALFRPDQS